MRRHRRIVGRFPDSDEIVGSECPIPVLQGYSSGSSHFLDGVYGLGEVLDVANALIGEVYQHDVGCHVRLPVPKSPCIHDQSASMPSTRLQLTHSASSLSAAISLPDR